MRVAVIIGMVALWITGHSLAMAESESKAGADLPAGFSQRDLVNCGPASLFMFLLLSGHSEVTWEQINTVPVTFYGSSLADLRNAANRFGVVGEMRRYRLEDIDSMPLPAIGVFNSDSTSITSNHYGVIYRVDAHRIYALDGSTGNSFCLLRQPRMFHFWTGIALTQKIPLRLNEWRIVLLLTGITIVEWGIAFVLMRHRVCLLASKLRAKGDLAA
jgi:hypothetical protein